MLIVGIGALGGTIAARAFRRWIARPGTARHSHLS